MNLLNKLISTIAVSLVASLFCECTDENEISSLRAEGKVMISLNIDLPSLEATTRTIEDPKITSDYDGIWIGIYSATTGKRTNDGDGFYMPNSNRRISNIKTKTGASYIVGVANPSLFEGCTIDDPDNEKSLKELLLAADTWDKFKSIILKLPEGNIFDPFPTDQSPMPMSGFFHAGNGYPSSWENPESVNIVYGKENVDGTLYFRRPWSEITFEVYPASSGTDITDIELLGAKVINVPSYTWLFERNQETSPEENVVRYANAGDALAPIFSENDNYPSAPELTTGNFICTDIEGTPSPSRKYSFTFYMTENKRDGIPDICKDYSDRELSWINSDGQPIIYKSLCSEETGCLNNNATVVELRCRLTYRNGDAAASGHTSEATFRVHLGYSIIKGSGLTPSANDFNSRRNAKYNYKVKVINAKQIELQSDLEDMSGYSSAATGSINLTSGAQYDLDAHYNVFPIDLTEDDITNFNYRIESWYDGTKVVIDNRIPDEKDDEWKHYSWIELVKHQDSEKDQQIVAYPGKRNGRILHLGDIKSEGAGHYTVFIKEYTYEDSHNESSADPNWRRYVNQPPRCFWMVTSKDNSHSVGASSYNKSKYYASQRSIETYYSTTGATTALGIEHENECFGMNVRWTKGFPEQGVIWDEVNGKSNVLKAMNGINTWSSYIKINDVQNVNELDNTIKGGQIENSQILNYPQNYSYIAARKYPVNGLVLIPASTLNSNKYNEGDHPIQGDSPWACRITYSSPQYSTTVANDNVQYFEALYGCMNRNRDEDGDGIISNYELKWYLPTSKEMMQIVLGDNSLQSPLYDFASPYFEYEPQNRENVLYHYTGSDSNLINMDYGYQIDYNGKNLPGWQIRCVRRLGTDLYKIDDIPNAPYSAEIDENGKGGVVKVNGYAATSLRNRATGVLDVHKNNSLENRVCRFGFEISPIKSYAATSFTTDDSYKSLTNEEKTKLFYDNYIKMVQGASSYGGVCNDLNQTAPKRKGWRIPNQKELIIMQNIGALDANGYQSTNYFISSTQSYYSQDGKTSSLYPGLDYFVCMIGVNQFYEANPFQHNINGNPVIQYFYIRCVRDLTAEEASMSYDDIKKHSSN